MKTNTFIAIAAIAVGAAGVSFVAAKAIHTQSDYWKNRAEIYAELPVDGKTVIIGDSIVDYAPWGEYFPGVVSRGISGDTTLGVLRRIESVKGAEKVIVMIGVNDLNWEWGVDYALSNYREILEAIDNPVAVSVLPVNPNPDLEKLRATNEDIARLNAGIKAMADEMRIPYVNAAPAMMDDKRELNWDYTVDGIHPNAAGYAVLRTQLVPHLGHHALTTSLE